MVTIQERQATSGYAPTFLVAKLGNGGTYVHQNEADDRFSVIVTSINLGANTPYADILVACNPPAPPPAAAFALVSGPCQLNAAQTCIYDSDINGNYGAGELCVFQALKYTRLDVRQFDVHSSDQLALHAVEYSGTSGPNNVDVTANTRIYFKSNSFTQRAGFEICATEPPAPPSGAVFTVHSGSCTTTNGGTCITDGSGNNNYGNEEVCRFGILSTATLNVASFDTESNYDELLVNYVPFSGSGSGLNGLEIQPGHFLEWSSDSSTVAPGFEVCANAIAGPPTTSGPTMSPTPSPVAPPTTPPPTNPTSITCGNSYRYCIETGGSTWQPQLCVPNDGAYTVTVHTCGYQDTLSDTRIYGPCENDDNSNACSALGLSSGTNPQYQSHCTADVLSAGQCFNDVSIGG